MSLDPDFVRERLAAARLYLILTRELCLLDPLAVLEESLDGGVDLVQVREPDLPDRPLLEWIHDVRERCARYRVPVIVNDRADLAILAAAEGVHVGRDDLPPRAVRELIGERRILGVSTHAREHVLEAEEEPVDYIGVGPVFDTKTKSREGRGVALLEECLPEATRPAFGVGGMSPATLPQAIAAGLTRAAVSSAICAAEEPRKTVERLAALLAR